METVSVEHHGAVAVVRLNAPPLNLLTQELRRRVGDIFEGFGGRTDIRAVVIAGGSAFCAGADLSEFHLRSDPAVAESHCRNGHRMVSAIAKCLQPTISAIEGPCLGGGFELALACDFRIAGAGAKIGLPETSRGVWPGTAGMFFLQHLTSPSVAKAMVFSGEIVKAPEARSRSLVDECTETGLAYDRAMAMAETFAARSLSSLSSVKRLMNGELLARLDAYLKVEQQEYVKTYQTHDAGEGVRAFLEKRPPKWLHR